MPENTSSVKVPGTVNPLIIAIVNAIPLVLGIGHIFLHDVKRFLFIFLILQISIPIVFDITGLRAITPYYLWILWIATIVDGFRQAKAYNKRIAEALTATQEVKQELAETSK
jgi:hypothetical protein